MEDYKKIDKDSADDEGKIFQFIDPLFRNHYRDIVKEITTFVNDNRDVFADSVDKNMIGFELIFTGLTSTLVNFIINSFKDRDVGMARVFQRIEDTLKLYKAEGV